MKTIESTTVASGFVTTHYDHIKGVSTYVANTDYYAIDPTKTSDVTFKVTKTVNTVYNSKLIDIQPISDLLEFFFDKSLVTPVTTYQLETPTASNFAQSFNMLISINFH